MAKTASTGFIPRKHLYGSLAQASRESFRAGNSATLVIGDAVRFNTGGLAVRAGAGVPVLGIVVGIVDENEINPFSYAYTNNTGATLTPDDTVVTASDNSSRAHYIKVQVLLDPAGQILYYNDADADLGQTNVGQLFDCVAASGQISQSTASDTSGSFQLVSLDPDGDADLSKGLFRIVENQLVNNVASYGSTAVVTA